MYPIMQVEISKNLINFGDFGVDSTFCRIALMLLKKLRMRRTAPPYMVAMSRLETRDFVTLPLLARVCDSPYGLSSGRAHDDSLFVPVLVLICLFIYLCALLPVWKDVPGINTCIRAERCPIYSALHEFILYTYLHVWISLGNHAWPQYKGIHCRRHAFCIVALSCMPVVN